MKIRNVSLAGGGFVAGVFATLLLFSIHRTTVPEQANEVPVTASTPGFRVYLAGQVHREGIVEIDANRKVTLTQAIILDGGFADFAEPRKVALTRRQPDGTSLITYFDFTRALAGRASDPIIQPDDLINVPQRLNGNF